jgi:hypothetical protein
MELDSLLQLLNGDLALVLKTVSRFLHFIGLALGLGAATLLDILLLRMLTRNRVTPANWQFIEFGSKIVNAGLIILWGTGLSFLVQYAFFDPAELANPKIWAKLVIVGILTINGFFIHSIVLPRVRARIGQPLFAGMSRFQKSTFIVSGAISATSWYMPLALGAFSQFNHQVAALAILMLYAALMILMVIVMHLVMWLLTPREQPAYPGSAYSLPDYRIEWSYGV